MLFDLFQTYNFETISNTVLKPKYEKLKVVGFGGFRQAVKYSGVFNDVATVRAQLMVETGVTLIDANKAKYIMFEDQYGNELVLAEDWVKPDTILMIDSIDLNLNIPNVTTDDITLILNTLRAMGYNKAKVL